MMVAPAATAARATAAFLVSMDTRASWRSCSTTGNTRRNSSSTGTGRAPGRVDSPPTSMTAAPSATMCRPWATAAPASSHCPPSEKESGVTLSTPITRVTARRVQAGILAGAAVQAGSESLNGCG